MGTAKPQRGTPAKAQPRAGVSRKPAAPKTSQAPRAAKASKAAQAPGASKVSKAASKARQAGEDCAPAADRFTRDLLVRGEAARLNPDGTLPRDATHVIETSDTGQVTVKRARLKAF